VEGEVVEVTSTGEAARRPVALTVRRLDGRWRIDDATLGPYRPAGEIVYENRQYGFRFSLPRSWEGYAVVTERWEGIAPGPQGDRVVETGPVIRIRHPRWTAERPRQDIPIMVFTLAQWEALQRREFHIGAAPVGPTELGRGRRYVFALPARYNYASPEGWEEVEEILRQRPLQALDAVDKH
jgi:hypothetical protein